MLLPTDATLCTTPASAPRSARRSATIRRTFDPAAIFRPVLESLLSLALSGRLGQEDLFFRLSDLGFAPVLLSDFVFVARDYLDRTNPFEIDPLPEIYEPF